MNRYYQSGAAIFTLSLFLWVGYSSCIKNKCVGVLCANNGVCVDGTCACPYGYEGATCNAEWYEKFSGSWHSSDKYINDTSGNIFLYDIQVQGSKDSFFIAGFADTLTIKCKLTSLNTFTISPQRADSFTTVTYGKASIDTATMTISGIYTIKTDTTVTTRFSWKR
jgi:hypothetical protein